jgi:hypothetical protein
MLRHKIKLCAEVAPFTNEAPAEESGSESGKETG